MRAELKLLNTRLGITTLYVTHDQIEAMTMGDRVAVLKPVGSTGESNLQQIDTPQTLYDRPANLFVAGFIGSPAMNVLHARLHAGGGTVIVELIGTPIRITLPPEVVAARPALAQRRHDDLIVGIRPEAFTACGPETADLTAEVLVTEALGADSFVFFELPAPPVMTVERLAQGPDGASAGDTTRLAARIQPNRAPRPKEGLPLSIDPSNSTGSMRKPGQVFPETLLSATNDIPSKNPRRPHESEAPGR